MMHNIKKANPRLYGKWSLKSQIVTIDVCYDVTDFSWLLNVAYASCCRLCIQKYMCVLLVEDCCHCFLQVLVVIVVALSLLMIAVVHILWHLM